MSDKKSLTIQITYDIVTEESAEHGDFEEHGFYSAGGYTHPICGEDFEKRCEEIGREKAIEEQTPDPIVCEDINDAISIIEGYGPVEGNSWLTQADSEYDEPRLSFHLEGPEDQVKAVLDHFAR